MIPSRSALLFVLVGIIATVTHVLVASILIETELLNPGAANGFAFILANIVSYVGNTLWSFSSPMGFETWWRFVLVSFVAWLLTISIALVVDMLGGHYLLGIALVVSLVPALSFIAHRKFTYA